MIPHVVERIIETFLYAATVPVGNKRENIEEKVPDILFVEIGGTVGDIEGGMVYEAIR